MGIVFTTPGGIASYPNVFKPRKDNYGNINFSVDLIISDPGDIAEIEAKIEEIGEDHWGDQWPKVKPKLKHVLFRDITDGDHAGCKKLVARCAPEKPPIVVDRNKEEILNQRDVYGGCEARLVVDGYGWGGNEKTPDRGISFGLQIFQKLGDGTPLGGHTRVSVDDLDDMPEAEVSAADLY